MVQMFYMGEENPTRITDLVVKMSSRIFTRKEDFTILKLSVHIGSLPDRESLADLTGGVKFTGGEAEGAGDGGSRWAGQRSLYHGVNVVQTEQAPGH